MSKNQGACKILLGENIVHESSNHFCIKQGIKLPRIHPHTLRVSLPPVQNSKMKKLKKILDNMRLKMNPPDSNKSIICIK